MRRFFLLLAFTVNFASAQNTTLPASVAALLAAANVPLSNVGVMVAEAGTNKTPPLVAHNIDAAFNPASVMKLLTTYAALELLGPTFTWKTEIAALGEIKNGTLHGDLAIKGAGDPKLTIERFTALINELRERGLKKIDGNLILDRHYFEATTSDSAAFDGEPLKAYNVLPDALLMNFKTVGFMFAPTFDGKRVVISPDAMPSQLDIVNHLNSSAGSCGDWQEHIKLEVDMPSNTNLKVRFSGNYPIACGTRTWNIALLDHPRFVGGVFANLWRRSGGVWNGVVKLDTLPNTAKIVAFSVSPPLAEVVRDINKYSNNVMARQLFLTLSAELNQPPGSVTASTKIIKDWLNRKGINANELMIENGAGLSRTDRISAQTLTSLLQAAWKSNVMPELFSSLPLLGLDGTMRNRDKNGAVAGQARIKSGTINEVRAMAGDVQDAMGKHWIVVMLVNDKNAANTAPAQDALLQWVYQH